MDRTALIEAASVLIVIAVGCYAALYFAEWLAGWLSQ